jgi:hypothetical protein
VADLYDLYVISDLDIGFYLEEAGKVQGFKFASNGVLRSSPRIHSEFIGVCSHSGREREEVVLRVLMSKGTHA